MINNKKSILVADDHQIFRQGLVSQIKAHDMFEVVAEAGDGHETLELIRTLKPEITIVDINMPGMSGLEVIAQANADNLNTDFIVLTMYKEEEYFNKAMDLGVKGYILKASSFENLLDCLKTVSTGEHYVSPQLSEHIVSRHSKLASLKKKTPSLETLTHSEKRVLKLIAEAKTSKVIAKELFISHRTEEKHRENICNKLGIKGANKLIQFAFEYKSLL